ncbi:hypothetical protein AB0F71_25035 [Kitasatospora sp. NPDC028055]|uniref:hypothetical protein n=1 Tax=Kitasatospora sp. NPDC028055 TaxID=3155653 RepID=UPI003404C0C3
MAGFEINHRAIDEMVCEIKKSFEQASQRHQIRVPIGTDLPGGSGVEDDPFLSKALLWLDERAAEQRGYFQDMKEFTDREQLPQEEAAGLALQLEQHGFVRISRSFGGDDTAVFLADEGRLEVRRLKKLAGDRVLRANYVGNALLRWLHDQGAPVGPGTFTHAPTAFFAGTAFTCEEVLGAVTELVSAGLAQREAGHDGNAPHLLRITEGGNACIRGGHTVRSYMDSQNTARTTTNNYHGTVVNGGMSGGVASTGDHNTINSGNSIDAQALADLVQGLRTVAPQLGLDAVDAEDYAADVEALERDGRDPEQGGRIWRRITRLAGPALTTAIATGVGQQLIELGSGLYS